MGKHKIAVFFLQNPLLAYTLSIISTVVPATNPLPNNRFPFLPLICPDVSKENPVNSPALPLTV